MNSAFDCVNFPSKDIILFSYLGGHGAYGEQPQHLTEQRLIDLFRIDHLFDGQSGEKCEDSHHEALDWNRQLNPSASSFVIEQANDNLLAGSKTGAKA
jgi:hypothetical protein